MQLIDCLCSCRRGCSIAVGAKNLCHSAGRVWYEVEVVEPKGFPMVGFAGTNFCVNEPVGVDATSEID